MEKSNFSELFLSAQIMRAVEEMGFTQMTEIQSKSIPLIRTGVDVIGRSQTGTGKTVAFGIPAVEIIDTDEEKPTVQVMIICPTRELAQQACEEINKISKFIRGINPVDVYGGAPMDRQILRLKKANIVIGTPGRIMDHMRRRTLKIDNLKMIILDEADEMLSMGFKEDIETILSVAPSDRQTVLFSATMPKEILKITKEFQKDPEMIEIDKKRVTVEHIEQEYVDVAMGRKMDALNLLLRFYKPNRAMIFCNTKRMVEEISEYLQANDFDVSALHGDMNQSVRTKVMNKFKGGQTNLLVCTDVAARGIDVNDIDYVINYDIPQNNEYYVHRIGRTGRAGKTGHAITICSGRRQTMEMRDLAAKVRSEIKEIELPDVGAIKGQSTKKYIEIVDNEMLKNIPSIFDDLLNQLLEKGYSLFDISKTLLYMNFNSDFEQLDKIKMFSRKVRSEGVVQHNNDGFDKIEINIGRNSHIAPNHIVGAIAERTGISGKEIGKIEIYDKTTIVGIPKEKVIHVIDSMRGCKICGLITNTVLFVDGKNNSGNKARIPSPHRRNDSRKSGERSKKKSTYESYNKSKKPNKKY